MTANTRIRPRRQIAPVPMPPCEAPPVEDLRTRAVLARIGTSPALAAVIAGLAFGSAEIGRARA